MAKLHWNGWDWETLSCCPYGKSERWHKRLYKCDSCGTVRRIYDYTDPEDLEVIKMHRQDPTKPMSMTIKMRGWWRRG